MRHKFNNLKVELTKTKTEPLHSARKIGETRSPSWPKQKKP